MTLRLRWWMAGLMVAGCAATPPEAPMKMAIAAPMPGGYSDQAVGDAATIQAAALARTLLAGPTWLNDPDLKVMQVLKAETQVVAGTNVRLTMRMRLRGQARWVRLTLFKGLQGQSSLSSVLMAATEQAVNWRTLSTVGHEPAPSLLAMGAKGAAAELATRDWLNTPVTLATTSGEFRYNWTSLVLGVRGSLKLGGEPRTVEAWVARSFQTKGWVLTSAELRPGQ